MDSTTDPVSRRFQQGEHVCAFYEDPDEQRRVAAGYVHEGLRCGERCMYTVGTVEDLVLFRDQLIAMGVDAAAVEASGALLMLTTAETHLAPGQFNASKMVQLLQDATTAATTAGYSGLRICGDMSWLLADPPGAAQVVAYEAMLNEFFLTMRAVAMCQYDRRRLPSRFVDDAIATHPMIAIDGGLTSNPFYRPAAIGTERPTQAMHVNWKIRELRQRASRG